MQGCSLTWVECGGECLRVYMDVLTLLEVDGFFPRAAAGDLAIICLQRPTIAWIHRWAIGAAHCWMRHCHRLERFSSKANEAPKICPNLKNGFIPKHQPQSQAPRHSGHRQIQSLWHKFPVLGFLESSTKDCVFDRDCCAMLGPGRLRQHAYPHISIQFATITLDCCLRWSCL